MKKQSIQSRLINSYLLITDRRSKYQERWFYSNPEQVIPPKNLSEKCTLESQIIEDRNMWIIRPRERKAERSVLFLHGGGFAKNFQSFHWRFIEKMVIKLNAQVFAPDYPLVPQASYKTVHSFVLECFRYLSNGLQISDLTVVGDSSGATIALNSAQLLKQAGLDQPREFVLLSPWLDLSLANPQIDIVNQTDPILDRKVLQNLGVQFADDLEPNNATISPIYQNLRRIAPITVFIGTRDIMLADCRKLKTLSSSLPTVFTYREFAGMFHDWMYFEFPEGKMAQNMIFDHIKHEPSEFELAMQENDFGW